MGEIDRVNKLAQAAKLINAFQRVNPADPRRHPRREPPKQEDRSDKVELSKDGEELPVDPPVEALPEDAAESHLDIAV